MDTTVAGTPPPARPASHQLGSGTNTSTSSTGSLKEHNDFVSRLNSCVELRPLRTLLARTATDTPVTALVSNSTCEARGECTLGETACVPCKDLQGWIDESLDTSRGAVTGETEAAFTRGMYALRLLLRDVLGGNETLRVGVFGGSVSAGHHAESAYSTRLVGYLTRIFGASRVEVRNGAIPAAGADIAQICWREVAGGDQRFQTEPLRDGV